MSEPQVSYRLEPLPPLGEEAADEPLLDLSAELGIDEGETDYSIRVYQHGARGLAWRFDYTLSDETPLLERLRDDYGGGVFEVRVIKSGKIARRHKAIVGAPVNKPAPKAEGLSGTDVMDMIQRSHETMLKQVEKIVENMQAQPAAAPIDPAQTRREIFAEMAALKDLFAPPPPQKQQDPIEALLRLKELERQLDVGQGGGDDSMMSLISSIGRDVIGPLAAAAQAHSGNGAARRLGHTPAKQPPPSGTAATGSPNEPVNNAPAPQPSPPPPPPPPEPDMNELQKSLSQLCAFALVRVSPAGAAQSLHDNASDEQYNMLAEIIEQEDCIDRLTELYEPVARHREWFAQLRAELQSLYALDAEGDDDAAAQLTGEDQQAINPDRGGAATDRPSPDAAHNEGAAHGDPGEDTIR